MGSSDLVQLIAVGHGRYQKKPSTHNDGRRNRMLEEYLKTLANHAARLGRNRSRIITSAVDIAMQFVFDSEKIASCGVRQNTCRVIIVENARRICVGRSNPGDPLVPRRP